jgi:hypothetical protein
MLLDPVNGLHYVASGDSVVNMSTKKVVATNTQISYAIASVIEGKVYVANCLLYDDFD